MAPPFLVILDICSFALNQFAKVVDYVVNRHNGPEEEAARARDPDYALLAAKLHQACLSTHGVEFVQTSRGLQLLKMGDIAQGIRELHREYYSALRSKMGPSLSMIMRAYANPLVDQTIGMIGVSFVNTIRQSYHTAMPWAAVTCGDITGKISEMKMPFVDRSKFLHFLELLDRLRYYERSGVRQQNLMISMQSVVQYGKTAIEKPDYMAGIQDIYSFYYKPEKEVRFTVVEYKPHKIFCPIERVLDRMEVPAELVKISQIATCGYKHPEDENDQNLCRHKIFDTILGGNLDEFVYYSQMIKTLGERIGGCSIELIDFTDRAECLKKFGLVGELSSSGLCEYADRLEVVAYTCAIYTSLEYLATAAFNDGASDLSSQASPIYPTAPALLSSASYFERDEGFSRG